MRTKCPYCAKPLLVPDVALKNGNPSLTCKGCGLTFKAKSEESPKEEKQKSGTDQNIEITELKSDSSPGWLVVHDNNTTTQTFELKLKKQLIGRRSESRPCDIMIETSDTCMSRNHFFVEASKLKNGKLQFYISDSGSLNHTFLNGKKLGPKDEFIVNEGDVIQAGNTNLVLKVNPGFKTAVEAEKEVRKTDVRITEFVPR